MLISQNIKQNWFEFGFVVAITCLLVFVGIQAFKQLLRAKRHGLISWMYSSNLFIDNFKIFTIYKDDPESDNGLAFPLIVAWVFLHLVFSVISLVLLSINYYLPFLLRLIANHA